MAEKKNVRPTWAMVRDLERRLASQIDGTSMLVADCDGWRELYRNALVSIDIEQKRADSLKGANEFLCKEIDNLREKQSAIEKDLEYQKFLVLQFENMSLLERIRYVFNTKL